MYFILYNTCNLVTCPDSWVAWETSCYRRFYAITNHHQAATVCANQHSKAIPAELTTAEELATMGGGLELSLK